VPIITFTAADIMAAKTLEAGYYPMSIIEIDGPKASSSGKSINFFFRFRITSGKYEGKELRVAFTNGTDKSSVLGDLIWMPTSMMTTLYAAITGKSIDAVLEQINQTGGRLSLDTDEWVNKPFDGRVDLQTGDTGLFNTISAFIPSGKGAAAGSIPF